jgi:hypothetical protein
MYVEGNALWALLKLKACGSEAKASLILVCLPKVREILKFEEFFSLKI